MISKDQFIFQIKEHVKFRELAEKIVYDCDMRQYSAGVFIVKQFLGNAWWQREVAEPTSDSYWKNSEKEFGQFRLQDRVVHIAEILLNLYLGRIEGLRERIDALKRDTLETTIGELEGAALLVDNGIPFRFVKPSGTRGQDYDGVATIDGASVACEMKAKLETTEPTAGSIGDTLEKARRQLPANQPGIILLKLPDQWGNTKTGRIAIEEGIQATFRNTSRITAIVVHWERWRAVAGMTTKATMFKVFSNSQADTPLPSLEKSIAEWGQHLGTQKISLEQIVCQDADLVRQHSAQVALSLEAFAQGKGSFPKVSGTFYGGSPEVLKSLASKDFVTSIIFSSSDFVIPGLRLGGSAEITLHEGSVQVFSIGRGPLPDNFVIRIPPDPLNVGIPTAVASLSKQLDGVNEMIPGSSDVDPAESFRKDSLLCLIHTLFHYLRLEGDLPIRLSTVKDVSVTFWLPEQEKPAFGMRYTNVSFQI